MEVAVIINSFNRLSLLRKSMTSICDQLNKARLSFAIIIFEVHSSDGSIEWIEEEIKKRPETPIHVLFPSENEPDSFSYGVNQACAYAGKLYEDLKYFLLYETDNFISSFKPLVAATTLMQENSKLAACGFTVVKYGQSFAGFGSSFPNYLSFILGQQFSHWLKLNEPQIHWHDFSSGKFSYCDVVYTSPLLIKKDVWKRVMGFDDKNFPFSDCDIDLAFRIRKLGYSMAVIQTTDVIHDNLSQASFWSSTRTLNFYKARYKYFRKHYGKKTALFKPLLFLMHLAELIVLILLIPFRKFKLDTVKVRWKLLQLVFSNYSDLKQR